MQRKYTGNLWISPLRTTPKKRKRAKAVKGKPRIYDFPLMVPQFRILEADTCEVAATMVLPESSIEMIEEGENENDDPV